MSDDKTREIKDASTFEERVFARLDSVDGRFDRLDIRLDRICRGLDNLLTLDDELRRRWEAVAQESMMTRAVIGRVVPSIGSKA